jgi:hypothetical protein
VAWLVGIAMVLLAGFIVLCVVFELARTALGFNGSKAALDLFWGVLLTVGWVSLSLAQLWLFFAVFGPVFEYLGSRDAKGGAIGPAIVIGFALLCLMLIPVVSTVTVRFLHRLRRSLYRRRR